MRTFKHIDWLSFTIEGGSNWRQVLPTLVWQMNGHGFHGYKRRYVDKYTGAILDTDSDNEDMGHHFTLSGEPLEQLRGVIHMNDAAIIAQMVKYAARCSRIDLTIDVWNCSITPAQLASDIETKAARVKSRVWRLIAGHDNGINGDTLQTGSPDSDRRFRLYDKLAEKRLKDREAWMRLELQLRRVYAKNAVSACADNGIDPTVSGHIASYLTWSADEYAEILRGPSCEPPVQPRKEGNRRLWLKGQVARALAAECVLDPAYREQFNQMVDYWIEVIETDNEQSKPDET